MKRIVAFSFCLFFTCALFAQVPGYKQLLDSATNHNITFVLAKPLTEFELDMRDSLEYKFYLMGETEENFKIDAKTLAEIIQNSKNSDTSSWLDNELDKFILVNNRIDSVSFQYVKEKLKLVAADETRWYQKIVDDYNKTHAFDRNIFSFSKPVFDNTRNFAMICYDKGHSGRHCRGEMTIYHFTNGAWKRIGDIYHCIY